MSGESRYRSLDRLLYRIAFRSGRGQQMLADLGTHLFREKLSHITTPTPVFISSLPRSGTTILLRLLASSGVFASQRYADMPFILCPLLWSRFSGRFAVDAPPRERDHKDGIQVSRKSPEAFEEMVWKHFWPEKYLSDRIVPWGAGDRNREFDEFFETHMRKVIAIRRTETASPSRYVSKNNLNIARLAGPPPPMRRGIVLIPFRDPVQQASSALRQHRLFSTLHQEDPFLLEYMEAIGHHEFGRSLRPVTFGGWVGTAPRDPDTLEFWVRYWIAAYRFILDHLADTTLLISYARLTESPESALENLARLIDITPSLLTSQADRLHPPRTHQVHGSALPRDLLSEAEDIHEKLQANAAV